MKTYNEVLNESNDVNESLQALIANDPGLVAFLALSLVSLIGCYITVGIKMVRDDNKRKRYNMLLNYIRRHDAFKWTLDDIDDLLKSAKENLSGKEYNDLVEKVNREKKQLLSDFEMKKFREDFDKKYGKQ